MECRASLVSPSFLRARTDCGSKFRAGGGGSGGAGADGISGVAGFLGGAGKGGVDGAGGRNSAGSTDRASTTGAAGIAGTGGTGDMPGTAGRFTRNTSVANDPVVFDSETALTWQGCAAGLTGNTCGAGTSELFDWQGAVDYCNGLDWAGHQDWQLPDRDTLETILNFEKTGPSIDTTAFPATPPYFFWSSSSYAGPSGGAWYVDFSAGDVGAVNKILVNHVRCVRRGS